MRVISSCKLCSRECSKEPVLLIFQFPLLVGVGMGQDGDLIVYRLMFLAPRSPARTRP